MNENDSYSGQAADPPRMGGFDQMSGTGRTISEAAADASLSALEEAKTLAGEVQQGAEKQADKVKDIAASHMDAFADALRAASEQLSSNQSGPASEMVAHAASGLESLARSLHGKSTGEMIETVRQFGRTNPIGFLAGSVLAGLALGRFATAGTPPVATSSGDGGSEQRSDTSSTHASRNNDRGITP